MRELNVNEIEEVNGGYKVGGLGGGILGYLGGRIFDLGVGMWNNRSMRRGTGGQMQRGRRRRQN